MSYIKITGVDNNKDITKYFKIDIDEEDIKYDLKEEKCNIDNEISINSDNSNISINSDNSNISTDNENLIEEKNENIFNKDKIFIDEINKKLLYIGKNDLSDDIYKEILKKEMENYEINVILNIENNFIKYVSTLKLVICTIKNMCWLKLKNIKIKNIFLYTGYNKFLVLDNLDIYNIEYKNDILEVWFSKYVKINNNVVELLSNFIEEEKINIINNDLKKLKNLKKIRVIKACCEKSMLLLDDLHRKFVETIKLEKYEKKIIAINSVAGSGKTTTLINLANNNLEKKILYIAFNKSLVDEMNLKIRKKEIKNMYAYTFDALMRKIYLNIVPNINLHFLKAGDIDKICPFLKNKTYYFKKKIIENIEEYCNNVNILSIEEFIKYKKNDISEEQKNILLKIWNLIEINEFQTFSSIRKQVLVKHYCKEILNNMYDAIFIDEAQDFDKLMLKILLNDTYITKIFVGDTKQAIYEWRGCINAFELLPSTTININFYSTYRIGSIVCNYISSQIKNLYIFSKSSNNTIMNDYSKLKNEYVYLFRGWKKLLLTAQNMTNIWINDYNSKKKYIENFCERKNKKYISKIELQQAEDDLPNFLVKLSVFEIKNLLEKIEDNLVEKTKAKVEFHTIHSYKGLENDTIRIYNDINIQSEQNLYYVALTRGMKNLIID